MNGLRKDVPPNPCWGPNYAEKTKVKSITRGTTDKEVSFYINPFLAFVTRLPGYCQRQLQMLRNCTHGHQDRSSPPTEEGASHRKGNTRRGRVGCVAGGSRHPVLSKQV